MLLRAVPGETEEDSSSAWSETVRILSRFHPTTLCRPWTMCPLAVISLPLTAIGLSTQNAPELRLVLPRSRVTQLGSNLDLCYSTDYTLSPESFTPTQSHDEDTDAPQSLENNSLHVCVCLGGGETAPIFFSYFFYNRLFMVFQFCTVM